MKRCAGCARGIEYVGRWTRGGCAVGNVVKIGHAERVRLTHPGNPANAGRRGRRPLRAGGKPRYQHRGKQMRKGEHLRPPLGSPERGAVAALCAVTEGLVQGGCGAPTLSVNPRRAGVEDKPLRVHRTYKKDRSGDRSFCVLIRLRAFQASLSSPFSASRVRVEPEGRSPRRMARAIRVSALLWR